MELLYFRGKRAPFRQAMHIGLRPYGSAILLAIGLLNFSQVQGQINRPVYGCTPCIFIDDLGLVTEPRDGVESRIGYSLQEFLELTRAGGSGLVPPLGFGSVANTECVSGFYSRFVVGYSQSREQMGGDAWVILVSPPYTESEAIMDAGELPDKGDDLKDLLSALCGSYRFWDEGWLSVANWEQLIYDVNTDHLSFRMTNDDFSDDRTVKKAERLVVDEYTQDYISFAGNIVDQYMLDVSNLIWGPNFPAPGFTGERPDFLLKSMTRNLDYVTLPSPLQDIEDRAPYEYEIVYDPFTGEPLITGLNAMSSDEADKAIYVVDCKGRLYISQSGDLRRHGQFLGGGAVAAFGEILVDNGQVLFVNTASPDYSDNAEDEELFFYQMASVLLPRAGSLFALEEPWLLNGANNAWRCSDPGELAGDLGFGGQSTISFFPEDVVYPRRIFIPREVQASTNENHGAFFAHFLEDGRANTFTKIRYNWVESRETFRFSASNTFAPNDEMFFHRIEMSHEPSLNFPTPNPLPVINLRLENCPVNNPRNDGLESVLHAHALGSPELSIYPNPANDKLTLKADGLILTGQKVEILDLSGKLIHEVPLGMESIEKQTVDVSDLGQGMYLMRLSVGGEPVTKPFSIQR